MKNDFSSSITALNEEELSCVCGGEGGAVATVAVGFTGIALVCFASLAIIEIINAVIKKHTSFTRR